MENNKKKSYKIILLVLIIIVNLFVFMACDIVGLCADSFHEVPYIIGSNDSSPILSDNEYSYIMNIFSKNNIDPFEFSSSAPVVIMRTFENTWFNYSTNGPCLRYYVYYPLSNEARITFDWFDPDSAPNIESPREAKFIGYSSVAITLTQIWDGTLSPSTGDFYKVLLGSDVVTGTRVDNGQDFIYNKNLPVYVSSPIVYMSYTFFAMPGDTGGGGGGGDDPFMGDDNDTPPDSNSWGQKIFNRLGGINNNIVKKLNKLSEILTNIVNKLTDLMDTLTNIFNNENNFFNSILDFTSQLLTKIDTIIAKLTDIVNKLTDIFNAIGNIHFVDVFSVDSEAVSTRIKSMLIYETVDTIRTDFTNLVNGFTPSPPDTLVIRVPLSNTMFSYVGDIVLDFGWYNAIRDKVQTFILAFFYCSFAFIVFTKLPSLISGAGSSYQKGNDSK